MECFSYWDHDYVMTVKGFFSTVLKMCTSVLSYCFLSDIVYPLQLYGVDSIDGDVVWQSFLPEATQHSTPLTNISSS